MKGLSIPLVSDDNAEADPYGLYDLNRQILTRMNIFVRGGIPNDDALSQTDGREGRKEDETQEFHRRSKSLLGRRGIQTQEPWAFILHAYSARGSFTFNMKAAVTLMGQRHL